MLQLLFEDVIEPFAGFRFLDAKICNIIADFNIALLYNYLIN